MLLPGMWHHPGHGAHHGSFWIFFFFWGVQTPLGSCHLQAPGRGCPGSADLGVPMCICPPRGAAGQSRGCSRPGRISQLAVIPSPGLVPGEEPDEGDAVGQM